jgi:hypothetical protein
MYISKSKFVNIFIWFITSFISLVAIIIILFNKNENYELLFFLPLGFLICNLFAFFSLDRLYRSIPALIIIASYFIRMVITPFLFSLGDYQSFYNIIIPGSAINNACLFMVYEYSIVFFTCAFLLSKKSLNFTLKQQVNILRYHTKKLTLAIGLLCLFLVFAYFYVPAIPTIYKPIFSTTLSQSINISWDNEMIVARGGIERYIYTLFTFLWPVTRLLLPSLLIAQIYKRHKVSKQSVFYSAFALLIPFFILSSDNVGPFISVVIALLIIQRLYKDKARPLFFTGSLVLFVALSVVVLAKIESLMAWRGGSGVSILAQMLNAYFPGFENVAITSMITDSNKWNTLFFDLYYAIPFKETLFGLKPIYLQNLFRITSDTGSQIIPFTSQIAHYCSLALAPFITAFFVILAINLEQKSNQSDNYWEMFLYTYTSILTAMSINNYSFSIYFGALINIALPIKLIMVLARYKSKRIKRNLNNTDFWLHEKRI